jgi:hypothetical protein
MTDIKLNAIAKDTLLEMTNTGLGPINEVCRQHHEYHM